MKDHFIGSVDAWLTCTRRWSGLGRNGSVTNLGGYWIPVNSALSHMIEKMVDREVGTPRNKVIELHDEKGVYNLLRRDEGGTMRG